MTEINTYLASSSVMYIKLHNLHWNVVGKDFKAVHEYLEALYNQFADVVDDVAELIKMNGGMPLCSMKDYLVASKIVELDAYERASAEVFKIVKIDLELLQAQALSIRNKADDAGCFATVALMEDHIVNYKKTLWFINSMLK